MNRTPKRFALSLSVVASLGVHAAVLYVLTRCSIPLGSPLGSLFGRFNALTTPPVLRDAEEQKALEIVLNAMPLPPQVVAATEDGVDTDLPVPVVEATHAVQMANFPISNVQPIPHSPASMLPTPAFSVVNEERLPLIGEDLYSFLPKLPADSVAQKAPKWEAPPMEAGVEVSDGTSPTLPGTSKAMSEDHVLLSFSDQGALKQALRAPLAMEIARSWHRHELDLAATEEPLPPLSEIQTPQILTPSLFSSLLLPTDELMKAPESIERDPFSQAFDVDVQVVNPVDKQHYAFSLDLHSTDALQADALKQHFLFLIDRSAAVEKHRFGVYKRAVLRALAMLRPEDTFNIYLLDKQVTKLSAKPVTYSQGALHMAELFLEKEDHPGRSATRDLTEAFEKVLKEEPLYKKIQVAVLLTDGNVKLGNQKERRTLEKWTERNRGKIHLYTATCGQHSNPLFLEQLSSMNGGRFIYSDTHAAFPRRLAKLMLTLRHPVATDLLVELKPKHDKVRLAVQSGSSHLPVLYAQEIYPILGSTDELSDMILTVRGRRGEEWFEIKKEITFQNAKIANEAVARNLAIALAHQHYEKFLREGEQNQLQSAQQLLKVHGIEMTR